MRRQIAILDLIVLESLLRLESGVWRSGQSTLRMRLTSV